MIFFALACAVSSFSILTKCRYLVLKLRTRFAGQAVVHANVNVNLVSVGPVGAKLDAAKALTRTKSAAEVKAQIEKSAFERRRYTIAGFLALFEVRPVAHRRRAWVKFATSFSGVQDLPMGTPRLASKLACRMRSTHLCASLLLKS
jgi:hypothetical protein